MSMYNSMQWAALTSVDFSLASLLQSLILLATGGGRGGGYLASKYVVIGIDAGLLFSHGLVNSLSITVLSYLGRLATIWNIVGVLVLMILIPLVSTERQSAEFVFTNFNTDTGAGIHSKPYIFLLGMLICPYALAGYDASAHLETKASDKSGAYGILSSIISSTVLGFADLLGVAFATADPECAIAIQAHLKSPVAWDGAIFIAPMCKISQEMYLPQILVPFLKCLAQIIPKAKLVPTGSIADNGFRGLHKREQAKLNMISYSGKPRLGTALSFLRVTESIEKNLSKVSLPFLILHGAAHTVTDSAVSQALYEQACTVDKKYLLYDKAWHAVLVGEPDETADRAIKDIVEWLDTRTTSKQTKENRQAILWGFVPGNGHDLIYANTVYRSMSVLVGLRKSKCFAKEIVYVDV